MEITRNLGLKSVGECTEKEKQKPVCEVCNVDVPEGHTLCKEHWKEKQEQKKKLRQVDYVKKKKEQSFKEKFEGKFYFNSQKVKSKSELLICYFLEANQVQFRYELMMNIDGELRPDFILVDGKGNMVILEHFGMDDKEYLKKRDIKVKKYKKFCSENEEFSFIETEEEDIFNLKDRLGKKLNTTPLKRALWK
ncbi:MAG: hypothetical protein ABH828_02105 [archaeon]